MLLRRYRLHIHWQSLGPPKDDIPRFFDHGSRGCSAVLLLWPSAIHHWEAYHGVTASSILPLWRLLMTLSKLRQWSEYVYCADLAIGVLKIA